MSFDDRSDDTPPPVDGWDDVADMITAKDTATLDERARCEAIVRGELDRGRLRGIPESSGVMRILHHIAIAIQNG
jgi:hypothetical protein